MPTQSSSLLFVLTAISLLSQLAGCDMFGASQEQDLEGLWRLRSSSNIRYSHIEMADNGSKGTATVYNYSDGGECWSTVDETLEHESEDRYTIIQEGNYEYAQKIDMIVDGDVLIIRDLDTDPVENLEYERSDKEISYLRPLCDKQN